MSFPGEGRSLRRGAIGLVRQLGWALVGLVAAIAFPAIGAAAIVQPALTASAAIANPDREEAVQLNRQVAQLYAAGRSREAIPLAERALQLAGRSFDPADRRHLAALGALATLYREHGRLGDAEPLARRFHAVAHQSLGGSHRFTLAASTGLAALYLAQGRYAEAEELARDTLTISETALGRDHEVTLSTILVLATTYVLQTRFAEAEPLARRALADSERALGPDHVHTLSAIATLTSLLTHKREYAEAEALSRRALAAADRINGAEHPATLQAVNSLAFLTFMAGQTDEAERLFVRARDGFDRTLGPSHPNTVTVLDNLAGLYLDEDRYAEAEPLYRRVLAAREASLGANHPRTYVIAARLLVALARSRRDAPDLLEIGRRLLAAARARRQQEGANQQARPQQERERDMPLSGLFAAFADGAYAATLGRWDARDAITPEAYEALQDSIAGAADRAIAEQAAQRYISGRNPAMAAIVRDRQRMLDQWAMLDADLAQSFATSAGLPGQETAIVLRSLQRLEADIDAIDERLRSEDMDYFSLIRPQPVSVAQSQALLAPDEAILLVVPSIGGTHIVAVSRERVLWHLSGANEDMVADSVRRLRLDAGARIDATPAQLVRLPAPTSEGAPMRFDRGAAFELHRELIAPMGAVLAGKTRLFVAAGGSLAGLPFSLLVSAQPHGADDDPAALRATRWLADDFEITHIPSVQSLAILRDPRTPPSTSGPALIGIGNPILGPVEQLRGYRLRAAAPSAQQLFERGPTRNGSPADLYQLRNMPSLPGTARELQAVRARLNAPNSMLFTGARATEPLVRAIDYRGARLVLFATHGLTGRDAGGTGEPGLVLTPPAEPEDGPEDYSDIDPANDGYLAASEVTTLRMDAEWVVLSACNTATGDDNANLSALARAFFYAGARNLLASHWPVSDEVAPLLIARTVAPVAPGQTRGAALQQAMRSIREDPGHPEWAHPFFWAPFVLIGDGGQ